MKNLFQSKSPDTDLNEVVDPQAPNGLNRKTILIIGLALACVITSIMVASMGGGNSKATSVIAMEAEQDPTYGGVFTLPSEQIVEQAELATPNATSTDAPPAWASALDEDYDPYGLSDPSQDDSPRGRYKSAVRSGGLFFQTKSEEAGGTSAESNSGPQQISMVGDRTIVEGTTIPAVLEQNINSDRPGPVKARVLHDVTDSKTLTQVLIPAGTQVIGNMEISGLSVGLTWHRLIFPDGRSLNIDQLPSVDSGGGGVAGNVNRHRWAQFGRAAMTALIGATSALGTAQLSDQGGVVGGALALQLGQQAGTMRQFTRPPTVTVPLGHRFDIWVQADLQF